jgi:hypothetical protein
MRYRLRRPIIVLAFQNNHELAVAVPAGKIVDVIGPARMIASSF